MLLNHSNQKALSLLYFNEIYQKISPLKLEVLKNTVHFV